MFEIERINPRAILPEYATSGSAGADLRACLDEPIDSMIIPRGSSSLVPTGLVIHIDNPNYAGLILPRSGLGSDGIILRNCVGLLDSDYKGEVKLSIYNGSPWDFIINHGDRLAQLVLIHVARIAGTASKEVRGSGGFGSTGRG